ncbi:bifunctional lytic transglycosylase/C40 family peptidase [Nocardiopsis dassonvillei]|uniref:C40 family peptidase n=1 Tax=Nocardiopsis dassonvillei TaxID=2014 RepID=UPI0033FA4E2C
MLKAALGAAVGLLLLVPLIGAVAIGGEEREREADSRALRVPGVSAVLLDAYRGAAERLADLHPGCTGMSWPILAGIGHEESHHAAGHDIDENGDTDPPVIGPRLDGTGTGDNWTPHPDTDGGRWDGDTEFDAAVGVTQLLPAWWAEFGVDGNGDGRTDPHNVYDAALATAVELCTSHAEDTVDFTDPEQLRAALFRYNAWDDYVERVMEHIAEYEEIAAAAAASASDSGHTVPGEGSERGRAAAEWALGQVGKPYVWGGVGPDGFDCSGLTMMAWRAAGVAIPRVTTDQVNIGTRVSLDALVPGDLLFYDTGSGPAPSHVTMYVGDGQMVNAPRTGTTIRVEPVDGPYYSARFMAAVRPG